jgi:hypothetical protein
MRTVRSRQFRVKAQPAAPTPEPADDMTDSNWRGADVIIRVFQRPDSKLMLIDPTNF